ncbi:polysaccharide lyase family 8 protein [Ganoderma leucocontextum]|nr:polysaccharide lyase family 8 protein [Ganoderma leucocontextum]
MLLPAVFTALAFANWAAASVIPIRRSLSNSGVSIVEVDEVDVTIVEDIEVIVEQRVDIIVGATTGAATISTLLANLQADGTWLDVDYTAGCDAPTANWKAESHWSRILTLASAWHGGLKNADQFVQSDQVRSAISSAMGFWFTNDFSNLACLDSGGDAACPCGTSGLWNRNWFSNVIGVPTFVAEVCLILEDSLSASELSSCTTIAERSFATFETGINGVSAITGANLQDIASIGIDHGLLTKDSSLLTDAFNRVHGDIVIQNAIKADGIRADGSFGQHAGIIYNGNYGQDFENDILEIEIEVVDTEFQASVEVQEVVEVLIEADQWMIFRNIFTDTLHWDFSVLGRLLTDPVADNHASSGIKTNLTQVQTLGGLWNSSTLQNVYDNLSMNTTSANSGNLTGNRMFYANDYAVQRGPGYVTSLRMYSNRTQNTECTDEANNFGFHLADGAVYQHINGDEYEDIVAAWDWNLIPGITVDYDATPLSCDEARHTGIQSFVGGASDGLVGAVAMRFENPLTKSLNFRKSWFFLEEDIQIVLIADISSTSTAPVLSVLDQRKTSGDVLVNGSTVTGGNFSNPTTLWHGGVGYKFNSSDPATLSVNVANKTGDWSAIGSSSQPPVDVDMFTAFLIHEDISVDISYLVFPGTTVETFETKISETEVEVIQNDDSISVVLDVVHVTVLAVFWETNGGEFTIPPLASGGAPIRVQASGSSNVILHMDTWTVTVADPTQLLTAITLTLTVDLEVGTAPTGWGSSATKTMQFALPSGGLAGSSLTQSLPA